MFAKVSIYNKINLINIIIRTCMLRTGYADHLIITKGGRVVTSGEGGDC